MPDREETFTVIEIERPDLTNSGLSHEQADGLSDETMRAIADHLRDAMLEYAYWDMLSTIIDTMKEEGALE